MLQKLNCMNYHVYDHETGDHWYATNGLRSLFEYAKISCDFSFKDLRYLMIDNEGEATIKDSRTGNYLTLTMI